MGRPGHLVGGDEIVFKEGHVGMLTAAIVTLDRQVFGVQNVQTTVADGIEHDFSEFWICLLYTSPSPRDGLLSRMPSSA